MFSISRTSIGTRSVASRSSKFGRITTTSLTPSAFSSPHRFFSQLSSIQYSSLSTPSSSAPHASTHTPFSLPNSSKPVPLADRLAGLDSIHRAADRISNIPVSPNDNIADPDSPPPPEGKPFSDIQPFISQALYKAITEKPFGYAHMSPVQTSLLSVLPDLIQTSDSSESKTKDLLVKAKTGTGKTLAFLIPAIESRLRDIASEEASFKKRNPDGSHQDLIRHMRRYEAETTGIVVLSPTRELATQIAQEAVKLTSHIKQFGIRLFVGGGSKGLQLREWERGRRDIVVATPGRLNDILNTSQSVRDNLTTTRTLIMDEADTLLEMGFKDEIDQIVNQLPPKDERSTYLFSATISPEISRIAKQTMKSDVKIIDCVPQGETNVHAHIPQYYTILPTAEHQLKHVFNLIAHDQLLNPTGKTIVFLPTTKMTQLFSQILISLRRHLPWNSTGLTKVYEMHGGRTQTERENIAKDFRAGRGGGYQILVTSDVSARGVDYPGVTRVVQIGVPTSRDIYVHRVGRTGRAGKSGRGDLVLLPFEIGYIQNTLRQIPIKPLTVTDFSGEVMDLAKQIDESGKAPEVQQIFQRAMIGDRNNRNQRFSQNRGGEPMSSSQLVKMQLPLVSRLEGLEENLKENILPSVGEEPIRECFGSLLGYYGGKAQDMKASKETILSGLKRWAVDGMMLLEEPYVSPTFLQKLGFNNERNRFGGSNMGRGGGGGGRGQFWRSNGGAQVRDRGFRRDSIDGNQERFWDQGLGGRERYGKSQFGASNDQNKKFTFNNRGQSERRSKW